MIASGQPHIHRGATVEAMNWIEPLHRLRRWYFYSGNRQIGVTIIPTCAVPYHQSEIGSELRRHLRDLGATGYRPQPSA